MACLHTMYNSEHKGQYCNGGSGGAPMSPRISFSNDFADAQHVIKHERSSREAPASSDFEFSVTNYSMMSADELFSKGRLLPYKGSNKSQMQRGTTTLRDELLVEDREDDVSSHRPPKGSSTRWKGLLGRKRTAHIGSKKAEKASEGSSKEERRSGLVHESSSQEVLNEGGSSWRGFEIGI
ncbi:PREDICTED: uncharacterized protein LOC101296514 [Fragaria vesca subsp. vesca]|uniref:uncharacterized protein LOC101296514 n=1 Tax=Fragaria vesca subsp. vesca TaxID=101020 RepID=UPI0002C2EEDA|nr:PREDICTED: uncharacterized protein LOC101296514 [Fragaria vesca subsp. vesca]